MPNIRIEPLKKIEYKNLINPVVDNPGLYFKYSQTGDILPKDRKSDKANTTIQYFNLNNKSLIERRKTVALQVKNFKDQLSLEKIIEIFGEFESFIRDIW
ncbi:MAG: hypothetical protein H8D45_16725 [Bacteroidetes bacterium]|nr:hypothetical protein [Bacteroidota bacterium]MBL7105622.1 hypothetical protein [Bacteroidales bacterium]